jgi:hypothetical protein
MAEFPVVTNRLAFLSVGAGVVVPLANEFRLLHLDEHRTPYLLSFIIPPILVDGYIRIKRSRQSLVPYRRGAFHPGIGGHVAYLPVWLWFASGLAIGIIVSGEAAVTIVAVTFLVACLIAWVYHTFFKHDKDT